MCAWPNALQDHRYRESHPSLTGRGSGPRSIRSMCVWPAKMLFKITGTGSLITERVGVWALDYCGHCVSGLPYLQHQGSRYRFFLTIAVGAGEMEAQLDALFAMPAMYRQEKLKC